MQFSAVSICSRHMHVLFWGSFSFSRAISAHKPKMKQGLIPDELSIEICVGTNTLMAPVQGCALFTNQFELQGDASAPSVVYSSPCSHSTITLQLGYLQLQLWLLQSQACCYVTYPL